MKKLMFAVPFNEKLHSAGLLIGRLIFGGFMLIGHGLPKLSSFNSLLNTFPDPLGISSTMSLAGAVFSELICAALLIVGFASRLVLIPLIFTMFIAGVVVHAEGPFFLPGQGAKEPALLYFAAYLVLFFTGPGRYSLDYIFSGKFENQR